MIICIVKRLSLINKFIIYSIDNPIQKSHKPELMKDNDFKEWLMRSNRLFNSYNVDDAVDQLNPKQFIESFW